MWFRGRQVLKMRWLSFHSGQRLLPEHRSPGFRAGHNIWLYAVSLAGKHVSGTSHTALDLIEDQQNIVLIAQFPYALKEFRFCRIDTPLTLYGFHDDRTGLVGNLCFYAFKIIEICKFDSSDQWFEWILIVGITGYG